MTRHDSTHISINWNDLIISSDISFIFDFLIKIDTEILSILEYNKKLEDIRKDTSEILKLTSHLAKIIQDNNLNLDYKIDTNLLNIWKKFNFCVPARAEFIILFSYLEVLFSIYISFNKEIDDKDNIRNEIMNSEETRKFISKFLLNKDNNYFNKNSKKLWWINPKKIRELRNSLTHFYSLWDSWIIIVNNNSNSENKKMMKDFEKVWLDNTYPLSSFDLYKLLSWAFWILIQTMNDLYCEDKATFERKIKFIKNIVDNHWAVILKID